MKRREYKMKQPTDILPTVGGKCKGNNVIPLRPIGALNDPRARSELIGSIYIARMYAQLGPSALSAAQSSVRETLDRRCWPPTVRSALHQIQHRLEDFDLDAALAGLCALSERVMGRATA